MRTLALGLAVAVTTVTSLGARAQAGSTEGGKVFVGEEGVEVAIVLLKPRGDHKALIQVKGSGTDFDGKARLHSVSDEGRRVNYIGKFHGRDFYTVVVSNGQYALWVPERRDEVHLKYDDAKSKALNADAIFATWQAQVKDGTLTAMEAFDRKSRVAAADRELAEAATRMNQACGGKLQVAVSWSTVSDELLGGLSVASYCGAPLEAMRRLCESSAARAQLGVLKKLSCQFGPAPALSVEGDTAAWTTSKEGSNLEELASKALVGGDEESAGKAPWGKGATLAEKMALAKTVVCTDGKAHYVVVAPTHADRGLQLFYGDAHRLFAVPREKFLGPTDFTDPRHFNKTANPSFRGYDMRIVSSVEASAEKNSCAAQCGDRKVVLTVVARPEAQALLLAARVEPSPRQHLPHALLRDDLGVYYYVDRGFKESEEKKFRLFKGQKGRLKEQKMTNVVSDSEGEIFSTKTGSLRLIIDRGKTSLWIENGKSTSLKPVPVDENMPLIYEDLGVYSGERFGTPCDDL